MINVSPTPHTRTAFAACLIMLLSACGDTAETGGDAEAPSVGNTAAVLRSEPALPEDPGTQASIALMEALAMQPAEAQARYPFRHPQETLTFLGIEPGMTVVEALPGGGWYSKILISYLGADGTLVGVDYAPAMYKAMGRNEEQLAAKATWAEDWAAEASTWAGENDAQVTAFQLSAIPGNAAGTVDVVLFIRAMHHLARLEETGGFLTTALADTWNLLRPGGIVGVVQHMAPEESSDEWAHGEAGYVKKSRIITAFEAAGFELDGDSDINVNPADQPAESDIVWRLPPVLGTSRDNEDAAAAFRAIGESTRMTLRFRKPA